MKEEKRTVRRQKRLSNSDGLKKEKEYAYQTPPTA